MTATPQAPALAGESIMPDADSARRSRLVDVVVIAVAILAAIRRVRLVGDAWFFVDDWQLGLRTLSPSGLVKGYNGQLSTITVAVYGVLFHIFGFSTYVPYQVVAMAALSSVGVAMYFTTRGRIGTPLAALAGLVLVFPSHIDLMVASFAGYLALMFGILCAGRLNRPESRRSNVWLATWLSLSLASASAGVAISAGAIIFCCCTRPSWRRWAAILVPTGLWGIWSFGIPGLSLNTPIGLE